MYDINIYDIETGIYYDIYNIEILVCLPVNASMTIFKKGTIMSGYKENS